MLFLLFLPLLSFRFHSPLNFPVLFFIHFTSLCLLLSLLPFLLPHSNQARPERKTLISRIPFPARYSLLSLPNPRFPNSYKAVSMQRVCRARSSSLLSSIHALGTDPSASPTSIRTPFPLRRLSRKQEEDRMKVRARRRTMGNILRYLRRGSGWLGKWSSCAVLRRRRDGIGYRRTMIMITSTLE